MRRAAEEAAVRAGARLGKPGAALTLPGPKDERLIPALKVGGRTVAPGLAVGVGGAPQAGGPVPAEMAAFAAMVTVLAGLDPGLHHCLQALEFSGLRGLAEPAALTGYIGQLNSRLEEVAGRPRHSGPWLESVVRLHEALCSVVHLPPAPEDSWWGEWRTACNDALSDAALDSGAGTVKFPPGRYRSVDDLTHHDIAIHYPERPGQVLACVRAWSSACTGSRRRDGSSMPAELVVWPSDDDYVRALSGSAEFGAGELRGAWVAMDGPDRARGFPGRAGSGST